MMNLDLQFFGGRGASGRGGGISANKILSLPVGSKIRVQEYNGITGKPNDTYREYTLYEQTYSGSNTKVQRWSSRGGGSFDNTLHGISEMTTAGNGVVLKVMKAKKKRF